MGHVRRRGHCGAGPELDRRGSQALEPGVARTPHREHQEPVLPSPWPVPRPPARAEQVMTRREGPRRRTAHLGAVTATGVIAAVAGLGTAAVGAASPGAAASPPARIFACYSDATNDLFYLNYPKVTSCPAGP